MEIPLDPYEIPMENPPFFHSESPGFNPDRYGKNLDGQGLGGRVGRAVARLK